MKPLIVLRIYKDNQLVSVKQFDQSQITIGQSDEAQVCLEGSSVSEIHCMIEKRDNEYYICDLGSATGTFKNKQPILDEKLESGDEVNIGLYKINFFIGVPKAEPKTVSLPQEIPDVPPRPTLKAALQNTGFKKRKKGQTYAPPSEIKNIKEYLKPLKGTQVEVIILWKERILETYHLSKKGSYSIGDKSLAGLLPSHWPLIKISHDVKITMAPSMKLENSVSTKSSTITLEQNEILYFSFDNSNVALAVRFAPKTALAPLAKSLFITSSEFAGVTLSLIIVGLLAFYIYATAPADWPDVEKEEIQRVAKVVFEKPITKAEPIPVTPTDVKPPPPQPEKVKVSEETKDQKQKGKGNQAGQAPRVAQRASEVQFIPSKINRPKKFTSIKQGGAVKSSPKEGATAKSALPKDVSKLGLFGAFGGQGTRSKIDEAYSGAGEVTGMAATATGTAGSSENREGDDIGSKFKSVGAGGKGTATHGISGVGTKGRGGGTSAYGSTNGLGDRTAVTIQVGGAEEEFSGTIDKDAIRRVIREKKREIQACYERVLNQLQKGTSLEGRVVMSWEILEKGVVKNAKIKSTELHNSTIEDCMIERLSSWTFPEPPAGMVALVEKFPFVFKSDNNK